VRIVPDPLSPKPFPFSKAGKGDPIGIFDSGVGGLSVLRAIRQQLPTEPVVFLADQVHVPYGSRSLEEVCDFSEAITRYLLSRGAKLIVVACNTASAAALQHLRQVFSETPFVGMEPAVKPAAEGTQSGGIKCAAPLADWSCEDACRGQERVCNQRLSDRWLSPDGRPNRMFSALISSSRSGQ